MSLAVRRLKSLARHSHVLAATMQSLHLSASTLPPSMSKSGAAARGASSLLAAQQGVRAPAVWQWRGLSTRSSTQTAAVEQQPNRSRATSTAQPTGWSQQVAQRGVSPAQTSPATQTPVQSGVPPVQQQRQQQPQPRMRAQSAQRTPQQQHPRLQQHQQQQAQQPQQQQATSRSTGSPSPSDVRRGRGRPPNAEAAAAQQPGAALPRSKGAAAAAVTAQRAEQGSQPAMKQTAPFNGSTGAGKAPQQGISGAAAVPGSPPRDSLAPAEPDLLAAGGDMATAAKQRLQSASAASALWQGSSSGAAGSAAAPSHQSSTEPGVAPLRDLLQERGIVLRNYSPGQYTHLACPQCQGGNSNDHDLTVNIGPDGQSAQWLCFRASCGFKGGVTVGSAAPAAKAHTGDSKKAEATPQYVLPKPSWRPLGPEALDFFRQRGISAAVLERNGIMEEALRWSAGGQPETSIAFPYFRGDRLLNIKYRSLEKKFRQVKGAEKVLFGLNDIVGMPEIIIVEGEMDKLALEEAGFRNVVSVPDGAPSRAKTGALPPPDQDVKYSYLWNCRGELDQAARIVIATDNDGPGQALAEELSRRLGRERCWRVRWPGTAPEAAQNGADEAAFRKDANHVLMEDGPDALRGCLDAAEPYPIRGLFRFSDFWDEIKAYHGMQQTSDIAVSTGWKSVDEFYRIVPGELTIITGVPNSGKSEWIDALLCNLTHQHGWSFALCSMEKKVTDHARQLLEKHLGLPFLNAGYSGPTPRMNLQQVEEGMQWLDDCFHLIRCQDDELPSIDWVLDLARAAVLRYGIRGLVIDPYNELDHQRPGAMSETEYVSQMLTKIKRFAQHHDVHVWFVAHPRQMRDWKGDPPNLYDISGSAHFINKCDNGVVVHRNNDPNKGPQSEVNILVRKVRNKAAGSIGNAYLTYDRKTGRYKDAEYQTNP